jgi:DnaJ-class molecular chaperone
MIGLTPQGYEGYDVEDCPRCDGSGLVIWDDEHMESCETCDGEGKVAA